MKFQLSKSIKHIDTEYSEIEVREPTVDDLIKLGYPYTLNTNTGEPSFNAKIVVNYLVELTALPPSTCKKICFTDLERFKWALASFFMDSLEEAQKILSNS